MEELRRIVTTCKDYETEMGAAEVAAIKTRLMNAGKFAGPTRDGPTINAGSSLKDVVVAIFKDQAAARYSHVTYGGGAHGEENFKRDLAGGRRRRSRSCSRRRRSRRCSRR